MVFRFAAGVFLLLLASVAAFGQAAGRLSGSVTDPQGEAVPGAEVQVYLGGGEQPVLSTVTTAEGLFRLPTIQAGLYDVAVQAPGFQRELVRGVKVDAARETSLPPIELELGDLLITVEVTAAYSNLQTNNAEISTTVSSEQIRRLPLLDRNPLRLVSTQAGVTSNPAGATTINGQRTSFSQVTFDGINIQDNFSRSNGLDFTPNFLVLDQVAEFTLTTSNGNPSVSGSSRIDFVSPSGTNELHGTAYWSHRNNALAANGWFANADGLEKRSFAQNQIGGTLNGPIIKDKLLFSQTIEIFRLPDDRQQFRRILTEDARNGIYSYIDPQGELTKLDPRDSGIGVDSLYDPRIQQTLAQIPGPEAINNFRFGDSTPETRLNTGGYSFLQRHDLKRENLTSRIDYIHSYKNNFTASFHWNRAVQDRSDLSRNILPNLLLGNGFSEEPAVQERRNPKLLSLAWRWSPTATFTHELRGGFNFAPLAVESSEDLSAGFFQMNSTLFSQPQNLFPTERRDNKVYTLRSNSDYVFGSHSMNFGLDIQSIRAQTEAELGIHPEFRFRGVNVDSLAPDLNPAQSLQAALLYGNLFGNIGGVTQRFNIRDLDSGFIPQLPLQRRYGFDQWSLYFRDQWKVDPRVSLTLGVRYELNFPATEQDGLALLPRIEGDAVQTLLSNHTLDLAGNELDRPFHSLDRDNFAPNVGLAWDVFGTGTTVLRASYGLYYVNDETLRTAQFVVEAISGLALDATASAPPGGLLQISDLEPPYLETPEFRVPRTIADNYAVNTSNFAALVDPRLRTPNVQEWSVGVQKTFADSILEARYVGNRGIRLTRTIDFNYPRIEQTGFLDDFNQARANAALALRNFGVYDPRYNPNLPGSEPLPVFDQVAGGGFLLDSTVQGLLRTEQAGDLAAFYETQGLAGDVPLFPNQFAPLGALYLSNFASSNYHSLQLDLRFPQRKGLQYQVNYTFGKVLTDAEGTDPARFETYLDPDNGQIEYARASFDVNHAIKGNFIWRVPTGNLAGGWERLLGGWDVTGVLTYQSGNPFSIVSQRGTLITSAFSQLNTVDTSLTQPQLEERRAVRRTGAGPVIFSPDLIAADGRGNPQLLQNPRAGDVGALQRRILSGPWTFNLNMALLKTFTLAEGTSLEFRGEATNIFNNPSWLAPDQDINNPQFGSLFQTAYPARRIQLGLYLRF